jgi:hypothetical protein
MALTATILLYAMPALSIAVLDDKRPHVRAGTTLIC